MSNQEKEPLPCEHPERLKGKPGECSPEQRRECHGDTPEHPAAPSEKE